MATITYPKAAGNLITSSDYNKILEKMWDKISENKKEYK